MEDTASGELFTLRNQFYTGQHQKVISNDVALFSELAKPKVLEFQIRSTVALSQDASQLIEFGKSLYPEREELFQVLQAWNDLKTFGTDDSTYFDDVQEARFEAEAVLTALYLVKFRKDVDQSLVLLSKFTKRESETPLELEPYLLLVQLHLHRENFSEAYKIYEDFKSFSYSAKDDIVYQVLESWVMAVKGESDNITRAYYFYDELLSNDFNEDPQGKFHILNVLFVLTLQLKHLPEAKEILNQISSLGYEANSAGDLIANKITYEYLTNNGANVLLLLLELSTADSDHQLLKDYKEKNERFDAIVEKYQVV